MKTINLGSRFAAAFGFLATNTGESLQQTNFKAALGGVDVYVRDARVSFEEMVLIGNGFELKFGYSSLIHPEIEAFAPPPMVTFSKAKRIEETVLNGVDGQVVENYGHKSWDVKIQGVLIDMEKHLYPGQKIRQLINFFDVDAPFAVESRLFADHRIKSIYCVDIESSGVQGFEDTWAFTLNCKSIKPVEFFLKSN